LFAYPKPPPGKKRGGMNTSIEQGKVPPHLDEVGKQRKRMLFRELTTI